MDKSLLDNHPALQAIRDDDFEDENEQVQIFVEHELLNKRLSKSLYYGRDTPSYDRLSMPITELCIDYFNLAGLDTSLTGQSDLEMTKSRLDRLTVARAATISRETCASPTSLVLALLYLERLRGSNPSYLHSVSSADLFLVSLLVASKFLHDDGEEDEVFNEEWANSAGMEKKDLNLLEIEFLTNIDWNCCVSAKQFQRMTDRLEKSVIQRQINTRHGKWTTYSDIHVLSSQMPLQMVWERLANLALQVTAVCLAAYAASLMTMMGTCYALTRANLGPSAVSHSLSTLKSAVIPSSKIIQSSAQPNTNSSSVLESDDSISHLSSMDSMTQLDQLSSEESEMSTITRLLNQNAQTTWCQYNEQNSRYLQRLPFHHHKRKPPYKIHTYSSENYSTDSMFVKKISVNDSSTFVQPDDSYIMMNSDIAMDNLNVMQNDKLCNSITSLRKFLAFSMPWKMDQFFSFSSSSRNHISDDNSYCIDAACHNSWEDVLNGPLFDSYGFLGVPSFRQNNALFDHLGKAIIVH